MSGRRSRTTSQQHQHSAAAGTFSTPRRRGSGGGQSATASAMLAAMFCWSKRPMTVRDIVDRQKIKVPAVVRVSKGYKETGSNRFHFPAESMYLIRDVIRRQLVVARTTEDAYVTVPRDSSLRFYVVSNDNALSSSTLTLSDLLGGPDNDDEGPCNGQRVQLAVESASTSNGRLPSDVIDSQLELVDIYTERYLVGHAFQGATLSPDLTVLPGYIPLTVDVTKAMAKGTDMNDYVTQLLSVVESLQANSTTTDAEEVIVFAEQPNNHYEWIEPPRPQVVLHQPESVDSNASYSSSSSYYSPPPNIYSPRYNSSSQYLPSPDLSVCSTQSGLSLVGRSSDVGVGRRPFDDPRKRPLPPIPAPASPPPPLPPHAGRTAGARRAAAAVELADDDENEELYADEEGADSPYEKFDEFLMAASAVAVSHRKADRTVSQPLLRTGSNPFLLDNDTDDPGKDSDSTVRGTVKVVAGRRSARLSSSQSLECLPTSTDEVLPPPRPSTTSASNALTSGSNSDSKTSTADGQSAYATVHLLPRTSTRQQNQIADGLDVTSSSSYVTANNRKYIRPTNQPSPPQSDSGDAVDSSRVKRHSMLYRQRAVVRTRRGGFSVSGQHHVLSSAVAAATAWKPEVDARSLDHVKSVPISVENSLYNLGGNFHTNVVACRSMTAACRGGNGSRILAAESTKQKPEVDVTAAAAAIENIYDQISSPLYVDMTKLSLTRKSAKNKRTDNNGIVQMEAATNLLYDFPAPGSRKVDDSSLYANDDELVDTGESAGGTVGVTGSAGWDTASVGSRDSGGSGEGKGRQRRHKVSMARKAAAAAAAAAAGGNSVLSEGRHETEEENIYLVPVSGMFGVQVHVERGQGVGAEKQDQQELQQELLCKTGSYVRSLSSSSSLRTGKRKQKQKTLKLQTSRSSSLFVDLTITSTRWKSLSEVPADVTSLTVEDVLDCLRLLNLDQYVELFRDQQIDGALLTSLDKQLLVNEFNFKRFDAIKLEKFACSGWRPKFTPRPPPHSDC